MSFRPEFLVQGEWGSNAQRFATREEAQASADARFMRWTVPTDRRVTESSDPVNYRWSETLGDQRITDEDAR